MCPSIHLGEEVADIITVSLARWGSHVTRSEDVIVPHEERGTAASVARRTCCESRDNVIEEIFIPTRSGA